MYHLSHVPSLQISVLSGSIVKSAMLLNISHILAPVSNDTASVQLYSRAHGILVYVLEPEGPSLDSGHPRPGEVINAFGQAW
jgi:hypothetical protein